MFHWVWVIVGFFVVVDTTVFVLMVLSPSFLHFQLVDWGIGVLLLSKYPLVLLYTYNIGSES